SRRGAGVPPFPSTAPGTTIDAGASTTRLPDGRIAVLATRTTLATTAQDYRRESVYALQNAPGADFGPWQTLGGTALQGDPVTATDSAGRRHLYAATDRTVLAWTQPGPGAP
ncbi:hypothetical protein ADK99_07950, partial [Streptomyces sp. MMG1064]